MRDPAWLYAGDRSLCHAGTRAALIGWCLTATGDNTGGHMWACHGRDLIQLHLYLAGRLPIQGVVEPFLSETTTETHHGNRQGHTRRAVDTVCV